MTRRTIQELINQAYSSLPDNSDGAIEPQHVRNMIVDFLDTITSMYGGLHTDSLTVNLSQTPVVLPFQSIISSYPPEWIVDATSGKISRKLNQVGAITSRITVGGVVDGAQGREVSCTLYKNGVVTGWATEETLQGIGKSSGFGFVAMDYGTVDAEYQLKVAVTSGSAVDVTFKMVTFIGENVPVRQVPPQQMSIEDGRVVEVQQLT